MSLPLVKHWTRRSPSVHEMKRRLSSDIANMTSSLRLDPVERSLRALLLDAAAQIDRKDPARSRDAIVLRWAGGWVRDKLLGLKSHDVDVAINCMTGEDFGSHLMAYCRDPYNREKHNLRENLGKMYTIKENPARSKHLGTATATLFGLDVDFVNLRKETYAEDSRNPQVEFGTAEEDALRRDATVNALFYNIHSEQVEDLVGGLEDMKDKIIRTPMEPFQTFMDDPLRVLRLIRFASRLGFTIEESVSEYMGDERVHKALRTKISRERVGIEIEKMLRGERPRDAVRRIDRSNLYHTVFTDATKPHAPQPSLDGWSTAYEFLNNIVTDRIYESLITSEDERYLAWILACVVPFAALHTGDPAVNYRKKLPAASVAAREGLKAPNAVWELVTEAVVHRAEIMELKDMVCSGDPRMNERDRIGKAIRDWEATGKTWRLQVLFAMLNEVMTTAQASGGCDILPNAQEIRKNWQVFLDHIDRLGVGSASKLKPLVNGSQLSQALGIKPGKWMTPALETMILWQLRNPQETDISKAIEEVRRHKEELGIADLLK